MITVSSLSVGISPTMTPSSSTTNSLASTARVASDDAVDGTDSTIVTIPPGSLESPLLYTPQGTLAGAEPTIT